MDDEWFEVTDDLWRAPGTKRPALKLLIDENVPAELVANLRDTGVNCVTAQEAGIERRDDADVLETATRLDRVLLTSDRRAEWIKRRPTDSDKAGVIIIPAGASAGRHALGLCLGTFALSFGRWLGATVVASENDFVLWLQDYSGVSTRYRLRLEGGRLMAREERDARGDRDR
jgi:hypothetical protein